MRIRYILVLILVSRCLSGQNSKISFAGKVHFISNAPLELIKAESNKLAGMVDLKESEFAFSVRVRSFEGFNSALQKEHLHENYLETEKYPLITYTGKLLNIPDITTDGTYEIRSKGNLTMHGISKERIIKNKILVQKGKITLESSFTVLLIDYNITIPWIVHKKIAEEIQISLSALGSSI